MFKGMTRVKSFYPPSRSGIAAATCASLGLPAGSPTFWQYHEKRRVGGDMTTDSVDMAVNAFLAPVEVEGMDQGHLALPSPSRPWKKWSASAPIVRTAGGE